MGGVTPYDSPTDPNPFNPNAPASGSPAPLPSDLEDPTLSMYWTSAPDFTPTASAGSGVNDGATVNPSEHQALSVQLGSLRNAENGMLGASSQIVDAYTALKSLFQADADWVFGQQAQVTQMVNGGGQYDTWSEVTVGDPINQTAVEFANGNGTAADPGMNAVQEYALQVIGNMMGTVGEFIAAINAAGAAYAQADASSQLPPAS